MGPRRCKVNAVQNIYICAGPCRYDACTVQTYKDIYGALEGMKSIQYKYIYIWYRAELVVMWRWWWW